jgi:hypothetical protein
MSQEIQVPLQKMEYGLTPDVFYKLAAYPGYFIDGLIFQVYTDNVKIQKPNYNSIYPGTF